MATRQPPVIWAQRESFLYVTIGIDDVTIDDLTADNNKLHFKGTSHTEVFETTMEFYDEIVGSEMRRTPTNTRVIELNIPKKDAKWWPRLLKEKGKVHWLKVDFDKWKDEDDSGAEDGMPSFGGPGAGGFDLNSYMNQMGGAGGGAPDFDGLDDESDGDMPDLEDDDDEAEDKGQKDEAEKNKMDEDDKEEKDEAKVKEKENKE